MNWNSKTKHWIKTPNVVILSDFYWNYKNLMKMNDKKSTLSMWYKLIVMCLESFFFNVRRQKMKAMRFDIISSLRLYIQDCWDLIDRHGCPSLLWFPCQDTPIPCQVRSSDCWDFFGRRDLKIIEWTSVIRNRIDKTFVFLHE